MSGSEPEICRQIRDERRFGRTRCGVSTGKFTLADIARSFGLADLADVYTQIEISDAASIAINVLSRDLVYNTEIMSPARATALWQQFLQLFDGQKLHFFSNCRPGRHQWSPATNATFDMAY